MPKNRYEFGNCNPENFNNAVDSNSVSGVSYYPYDHYDDIIVEKIEKHKRQTNNPHGVTKEQIGLGNVDNTADAEKPFASSIHSKTLDDGYQTYEIQLWLENTKGEMVGEVEKIELKSLLNYFNQKLEEQRSFYERKLSELEYKIGVQMELPKITNLQLVDNRLTWDTLNELYAEVNNCDISYIVNINDTEITTVNKYLDVTDYLVNESGDILKISVKIKLKQDDAVTII